MAEYIERGLVLETLERAAEHASCIDECTEFSIRQCISTVKTIPAVNVALAVHGRWVHDPASSYRVNIWFCSACNGEATRKYNHCPNCGAKMQEAR